ncbi:hypothetical protein NECAME_03142 [Necator americanus]|uniref:Uncharacterized protein n=1 Tax=Necator americanus TaxID=51031 RepID=W2T8F7_NECAM|nr:hypothetical protein NECAME_03142 [Necator americanus]ETN77481.1 hypothetical protein NECAME_03142 [Necator americanus]
MRGIQAKLVGINCLEAFEIGLLKPRDINVRTLLHSSGERKLSILEMIVVVPAALSPKQKKTLRRLNLVPMMGILVKYISDVSQDSLSFFMRSLFLSSFFLNELWARERA